MLSDTHIMANNINSANELKQLPTSFYHCSNCRCQLFTNLDIIIHEKAGEDMASITNEPLSPKQVFKVTKLRVADESNSAVRSRKISLEQADIATVVSGGFNDYSGGRPTARESKDFDNLPRNPLIFLDPVTGQRKCEYRCYNLFT